MRKSTIVDSKTGRSIESRFAFQTPLSPLSVQNFLKKRKVYFASCDDLVVGMISNVVQKLIIQKT